MQLIVAVILGFLSGLGTGGGSLLILWLTFVAGIDPATARTVNLLFFLPAALVATFTKKIRPDWKKLLPPILAGCTGAALGSLVSHGMDLGLLRKLFGGLLIYTGLREVFWKPKS